MKAVVFYSINEGLFFWNGQHGLLMDYLFDNLVTAWSDLPDTTHRRMLEQLGEFSRPHTLLFTHAHPDHYSAKYVQEYAALYPSHIYGPGIPESDLHPLRQAQGMSTLALPGYRVVILQAEHQGTASELKIDNAVLCVQVENEWYIHCGDSVLDEALFTALERCGIRAPEAVFANYYHIVPKDQRELLKRFHAKHTFAIHFPFEENDEFHIKKRLTRFLRNADDPFLRSMIVPEPMSRIL